LSTPLAEQFDQYCREYGFKKSTLAARLIREHLEREGYSTQPQLFRQKFKDEP
tara:strand:+ start:116 stop:274 length:159 start_codon:yes stop_codon:yes gene_type:complete